MHAPIQAHRLWHTNKPAQAVAFCRVKASKQWQHPAFATTFVVRYQSFGQRSVGHMNHSHAPLPQRHCRAYITFATNVAVAQSFVGIRHERGSDTTIHQPLVHAISWLQTPHQRVRTKEPIHTLHTDHLHGPSVLISIGSRHGSTPISSPIVTVCHQRVNYALYRIPRTYLRQFR